MSIRYDESQKLLTLDTKRSTYQMLVDQYGFLQHLYYGRKVEKANMSYMTGNYDRGFSGNPYEAKENRSFSLDTLPQEYTSFGVGDFRINGLSVVNGDGSYGADFRYVGHRIEQGKYSIPNMPSVYDNGGEADTLIITLMDHVTRLQVRLYYGVFEEKDIITRAAEIVNVGSLPVKLEKAASMCLDMPFGQWDLVHFHGRHCMERQVERAPLIHSIQTIASKRGMTSHHHNPFIILCDHEANEDHGDCYGMMFMYSGNHKTEIEVDQLENVRVVMGIHDAQFMWNLNPHESFHTPEVIMTYSANGFTTLSHNYHTIIRHNVCRGKYKLASRPILINNWEATYFDFNSEKLLHIARQAAELGVEMFVLDDGWFGARNSDNEGLGDWYVNEQKLPGGLTPLIKEINNMGMKFGIWIEPEMVNENSNLYRAHPDWAFSAPNRHPMMGRNQLVLDFSRQDVQDYIYDAIAKLLAENNIEYVKWDMNRSLADVYSYQMPRERQGEVSHRYVLGVYKLMQRLTERFPNVLFEGCSGGGGRYDPAMIAYYPQYWVSDNTKPLDNLKLHYGTSFLYPVCTMGAHVSDSSPQVPIQTKATVAMCGTFGYELDATHLDEKTIAICKEQSDLFRKYYPIIFHGDYYRLTDPFTVGNFTAWQSVSKDKSKSLLSVVVTNLTVNGSQEYIKAKGLDPNRKYRVNDTDTILSGTALMYAGLPIPREIPEFSSLQFYLEGIGIVRN